MRNASAGVSVRRPLKSRRCPHEAPIDLTIWPSSVAASTAPASRATPPARTFGAALERDDLPRATSSEHQAIHGGLRYLEYFEFRLVREALPSARSCCASRRISSSRCVRPAARAALRPAWMIRSGLFLYDHLGGRRRCRSRAASISRKQLGRGTEVRVHVAASYTPMRGGRRAAGGLNAMEARARGAEIRARTRFVGAQARGGLWRAKLAAPAPETRSRARALVNATGPWVAANARRASTGADRRERALVKGSHIVVPRVYRRARVHPAEPGQAHRVPDSVSAGATRSSARPTSPVDASEQPQISDDEIDYLLELANAYLAQAAPPRRIVWSYSGVRPLYDDGAHPLGDHARLPARPRRGEDRPARRCCRSSAASSRPTATSPSRAARARTRASPR